MKFNLSDINFSRIDIQKNLKLPTKLTPELAEDIGIMVGDGNLYYLKRKNKIDYQIRCFGDLKTDKTYFKEYINSLKLKLFNFKFYSKENYRDNTYKLYTNSKGLFLFYTKVIGLPSGSKNSIQIPELIKYSNKSILLSFLRGIGDTDFSISFRRKGTDTLYYPVIKLDTVSKELILDLYEILKGLGFKPNYYLNIKRIHSKTKRQFITNELFLNGKEQFLKWMKLIGTSNLKNKLKYLSWKRKGYSLDREQIIKIIKKGLTGFEPATT